MLLRNRQANMLQFNFVTQLNLESFVQSCATKLGNGMPAFKAGGS